MFAPDAAVLVSGPALHNPRRRQRPHSDDSTKPTRRNKRAKISKDTFVEPSKELETSEVPEPTKKETSIPNGHASQPSTKQSPKTDAETTTLTLRGSRKHEKRGNKGDGSTILCKTDYYTVSALPALPDQLRIDKNEISQSSFSAEHGYALCLTRTHAVMWKYGSSNPSPDTFYLALPDTLNDVSQPLPIGTFVSKISNTEPGLLVVWPGSGKVVYWETISSAATETLARSQHHGVQGSIGNLHFNEKINNLFMAEPAGFIVTLSSGRMVHLNVRDSQGRAAITTHLLSGSSAYSRGGFFGGLRSVFTGYGSHCEIAALKAGPSRQKGQRDVISITSTGLIQIWDLHWSGNGKLVAEVMAGDDILEALKQSTGSSDDYNKDGLSFEIFDLCHIKSPSSDGDSRTGDCYVNVKLILLAGLSDQNATRYSLLEITLDNGSFLIDSVHSLSYRTPKLSPKQSWKPKIYLPNGKDALVSGQMLFIVFENVVCLMSFAKTNDPETMLLADSEVTSSFQDNVVFRGDYGLSVTGCDEEDVDENHRFPSIIVMVRNYGVVRISCIRVDENPESQHEARVSAKSKMEQAVFYGTRPNNPLDFSASRDFFFSQEEIEEAALAISDEVLRSTSAFVPNVMASISHQLKLRETALRDLILHLNANYPPLSRLGKWQLLTDAEKIAAAKAAWNSYESLERKQDKDSIYVLPEMITLLNERWKTVPSAELGDTDQLRLWFVYDVWRILNIVPFPYQAIFEIHDAGTTDPVIFATLVNEAVDVELSLLETHFKFPQENASLYGLSDMTFLDGVLQNGYTDLPEIWATERTNVLVTKGFIIFVQKYCSKWWLSPSENGGPDLAIMKKIVHKMPRLEKVCCQSYLERVGWCAGHTSPEIKQEAQWLAKDLMKLRREQFTKLVEFGLVDDAIALAEQYRDMQTLVEVVTVAGREAAFREQKLAVGATSDEILAASQTVETISLYIEGFFRKYGDDWANAFLERFVEDGRLYELLEFGEGEFKPYLTRFFKKHTAYSKITWIQEILDSNDCQSASSTLEFVATCQETDLWSQNIQLSLAKLSFLAAAENEPTTESLAQTDKLRKFDKQLEFGGIQRRLYDHLHSVFYDALDDKAALELAMEQCAKSYVKGKPILSKLLERGLRRIVAREVMTVDTLTDALTLMDPVESETGFELHGLEFFLALKSLALSGLADSEPKHYDLLERTIWRRCMIRDDWEEINNTDSKDEQRSLTTISTTVLFKTLREIQAEILLSGTTSIRLLSPQDVLGVGCTPQELHIRFNDLDREGCVPLAQELRGEDKLLKKYIQKGRLEQWYEGVKKLAEENARAEGHENGEVAMVKAAKDVVQGEIASKDSGN